MIQDLPDFACRILRDFALTLSPESDKMAEMKKRIYLILSLLFIMLLASCATTTAGASDINSDVIIEKKHSSKKLLFKDWKYKGFGKPLPAWFEAAYKNDINAVRKADSNLFDCEIVILRGDGVNSDQADKVLKIKREEASEDLIFYDSCWARIGAGQYVALAVLYK